MASSLDPELASGDIEVSEDTTDKLCIPCLRKGNLINPYGVCLDSKEYYCKECYESHKSTNVCEKHELVECLTIKDKAGTCPRHQDGDVVIFCLSHKTFGCYDCINMHDACTFEYIPDKCPQLLHSDEILITRKSLDEMTKDASSVESLAKLLKEDGDVCFGKAVDAMKNFRKEIEDHLNYLQEKVEADANEKSSMCRQIVQKVLDTCATIYELQARIKNCMNSNNDRQLYITLKEAQSILKSDEITKARESLQTMNTEYVFERSGHLQSFLVKEDFTFGKLRQFGEDSWKRTELNKSDINIRAESDTKLCRPTGCIALSASRILVADHDNKTLKVVDTESRTIIERKPLDSPPMDVTFLPPNKIAVTVPETGNIHVLRYVRKLKHVLKIQMGRECRGITYHKDHLYVLCSDPESIVVLDETGQVKSTILLDNYLFKKPSFIEINKESGLIYISDPQTQNIAILTQEGDRLTLCKDNTNLTDPRGMVILDNGSLLICNYNKTEIYRMSGDLTVLSKRIDCNFPPQSICLNHHTQEVYVGTELNDHLRVFNVEIWASSRAYRRTLSI